MKKLFALLLTLVMSTSLAACGKQQEEPDSAAGSQPAETVAQADETTIEEPSAMTTEEIDAQIQGTWNLNGSFIVYDNGAVTVLAQGKTVRGTYTIDTDAGLIKGAFPASDGVAHMQIHFSVVDGEVILYNNNGVQVTRQ